MPVQYTKKLAQSDLLHICTMNNSQQQCPKATKFLTVNH